MTSLLAIKILVSLTIVRSVFVQGFSIKMGKQSEKLGLSKKFPLNYLSSETEGEIIYDRLSRKQEVLGLLGSLDVLDASSTPMNGYDSVLACPETKKPLRLKTESPFLGVGNNAVKVSLRVEPEDSKVYVGRTDTYYNLLPKYIDEVGNSAARSADDVSLSLNSISSLASENVREAIKFLQPFIPPPFRSAAAAFGMDDYIPMRDLFTSPVVSYAYERGWRQGFAAAGFPGADKEFEMVRDFFKPAVVNDKESVVVDMSCATGLFTRRLTKCGDYSRLLGCDFSEAMLLEARRRITSEKQSLEKTSTRLELVRCDVANIPMQSNSINALHAGAAMHCWPELDVALGEIYRVLKHGGRYFATTFLSTYFRTLQTTDGSNIAENQQAFQYFESTDMLKGKLIQAGFDEEKVFVDLIGTACIVIRCEK